MEGPGISLFQGSDSLQIDNDQEDEENEALEDERRRNDELRDLISNALNDYTDDDESFADSSRPPSFSDTAYQGNDSDVQHVSDDHSEGPRRQENGDHQISGLLSNEISRHRHGAIQNGYNGPNTQSNFAVKESHLRGAGDTNVSAQHYKHCARNTPGLSEIHSTMHQYGLGNDNGNLPDDDQYMKSEFNSVEQLQVLYEVRLKEIQHLHDEVEMTQKEKKQMELQLKRRLTLLEAEKERAAMSLKQSQNLLVTSKARIDELEAQITKQEKQIKDLEDSNYNLTTQLGIAKASVNDLQNKVSFLEKNDSAVRKEIDSNSYARLIEQRHKKEIEGLKEEVELIKSKHDKKEAECLALEKKVKDATKSLEATLADKTEVINRLARSLEESQARCEQLISSQSGQENCELRMQLSSERSEKEALKEKLSSLQKTIEMLQTDICNYEALSHLGVLNSESVKDSDSIVQLGIDGRSQSGSHDSKSDVNGKLKEELKRSLIGQRMKREEIKRLQMELEARDLHIQEMQLQESKYLAQVDTIKLQTQRLIQLQGLKKDGPNAADHKLKSDDVDKELTLLKDRLNKIQENNVTLEFENKRLEKENSSLTSENATLYGKIEEICKVKEKEKRDAIDKFQSEYLKFHEESMARLRAERNDHLEKEVKELRKKLEEAHKEVDEAKKAYLELCSGKSKESSEPKGTKDLVDELKKMLQHEKDEFSNFREKHNELVKQKCEALGKEHTQTIKKIEESSRAFYEKKVAEEIESAKKLCMKELDRHYQAQMQNLRKELEKEILEKQKSSTDAEAKSKIMENALNRSYNEEKVSELYKECCRLREELESKEDQWSREEAKIRAAAEREKAEELMKQQMEIEERLGAEFREQLKKAESTREEAARMLKEQLEAEQVAFLQKYEDKLHEYSLTIKKNPTRSIGTSPPVLSSDEIDTATTKEDWEKLVKEKDKLMEEKLVKEIAEAEKRAKLEAEALYSGNLEVFRKLMEAKAQEVEEMRAAMSMERNRLKSALIEARSAIANSEAKAAEAETAEINMKEEQIEKLKQKVSFLSKEVQALTDKNEKERDAMAEAMARWSSEVEEMRASRKNENRKLVQVYKKYQEIKRTVAAYKFYVESKDKHLKSEHKMLVENFTAAFSVIEERMKDLCASHEGNQAESQMIEESFKKKSDMVLQKLKQLKNDDPGTSYS